MKYLLKLERQLIAMRRTTGVPFRPADVARRSETFWNLGSAVPLEILDRRPEVEYACGWDEEAGGRLAARISRITTLVHG